MNKILVYLSIIIIVVILLNKKNETFMDSKKKSTIIRGIELNFGEVENLNDLEPLEVPDSKKILIKDIIKNYSIESLLFSHNLKLDNYINIFDGRGNRKFPKALQLKYERDLIEPVHNLFNSFVIGNNFTTNPENKYYGIQVRYFPLKGENVNRFSISLEFNNYMDLHLTKINQMSRLLSKKIKKKRSKIEIIGNNTKKTDFFPYFRKGDIKGMVLFKNAKNLDFIRRLNGYFNINDLNGNRILTKCKLDIPFCNVHLPQKGKIYGRDKYLVAKFNPFNNIFNILEKDKKEGFVGNFQDQDSDSDPEDIPIKKDNYIKYFSRKECMLEKDKNEERIKNKQFIPHENITEITKQEHLKPFQDLVGLKCIKHTRDSRDDFFFGGFDRDNNMFCYGEDDECFMFKDSPECEKMGLEDLLSIPPPNELKGIDYQGERKYYDAETIKELQTELGAELEETDKGIVLKCADGQYIEGTFNPEDDIAILGGIYRDCSDSKHPDNASCAPGPSHHLAELITNKGNKVYDASKSGRDSNFGNLMGKCIPMNIPKGRMKDCDPLDELQPCYVGERPTGAPGVSKPNTDLYKKLFGYNCHTRTIDTSTCKHNNAGILSDVISFRDPIEKNYEDILNKHKILQMADAYDLDFSTDEEKYLAENLHFYIEKYEKQYEDMNPNKYFQKTRYTLELEDHYDLINKEDTTKLVVYYKGKQETILTTNNGGEVYNIRQNDIIEILLHKDNHLLFQIVNPITKEIVANHRSDKPIEGEYGSNVNFYLSTNNNTFIRGIKYKDFIPKTVLPYNPFMDIKQV